MLHGLLTHPCLPILPSLQHDIAATIAIASSMVQELTASPDDPESMAGSGEVLEYTVQDVPNTVRVVECTIRCWISCARCPKYGEGGRK